MATRSPPSPRCTTRAPSVTGKVKTVDPKGAEIDLGQDIMGYLRASEISRDRVEDARNVLKEGDEVTAVVVNIDRKTRNIQLSIKPEGHDRRAGRRWPTCRSSPSRENAGTTSLGALLRAKLDNATSSKRDQSVIAGCPRSSRGNGCMDPGSRPGCHAPIYE